ncbi:GAF and ANTAR domain-containing protein [Nocardioides sp. JQ2195]|uniref:GAF and ANTAR domain-containing protein n=1 Tax=Nocardioides sp. JQ2195 TaxID=2592334 RepID=UPI00143E1508|nr:GAF and ANTAR domain-containing protein [Nocardioides sp. JQ2195]QIX25521.1 GAF and ANTAR domain-containing protein [Nocardioides sp. JQ2195]
MLSQDFEAFVEELKLSGSAVETAEQVVGHALKQLEADHAGITLLGPGGHLETIAPTDFLVEQVDHLQYELNEGCCVDSTWRGELVLSESLATDPRWPTWGPKAAELGVASVLAVQLSSTERGRVGSLNLYWTEERTFAKDVVAFAHIFARHAALALSHSLHRDDFDVSLDSRKRLGIAQGMLMERFGLAPDDAFRILQQFAQDRDQKLGDVVDQLISSPGRRSRG